MSTHVSILVFQSYLQSMHREHKITPSILSRFYASMSGDMTDMYRMHTKILNAILTLDIDNEVEYGAITVLYNRVNAKCKDKTDSEYRDAITHVIMEIAAHFINHDIALYDSENETTHKVKLLKYLSTKEVKL